MTRVLGIETSQEGSPHVAPSPSCSDTSLRCKWALAFVLAMPAVAFSEVPSAISDPTPVIVDADSFYLWRTATGGTMRVEWAFPLNATVAHLAVTGRTVKVSMSGLTVESADIELPTPIRAKDEDVLDFTLSFNDGTVKNASLGLVRGQTVGGGATTPTPCLASDASPEWRNAAKRFVMPVPAGVEAVTVSGEAVDTGLDGGAGWLALGPYATGTVLPVAADDASRELLVQGVGMSLYFK